MSEKIWSIEDLVLREAWLLHNEQGVVGQAKEFFDGVKKIWVSPVNGNAVSAPVLLLSTGDAFVVSATAFTPLSEKEGQVCAKAQELIAGSVKICAVMARLIDVPLDVFATLMSAQLRVQERQLRLAADDARRPGEVKRG
jgi:hypothetical protein